MRRGAVAAAVAALVMLCARSWDVWVLFAVAIFVAPRSLWCPIARRCFTSGYFYVNIVLFLVLLSYLVARVWHGRGGPLVVRRSRRPIPFAPPGPNGYGFSSKKTRMGGISAAVGMM